MKNQKRGFTLIELLVVIAIIGILASVVIVSIGTVRVKGADSAVKSNLNNARAEAELFYDRNMTYQKVCDSTGGDDNISFILEGAREQSHNPANAVVLDAAGFGDTITCNDTPQGWAAEVPLKSGDGTDFWWCVDSSGVSKSETESSLLSPTDITCL